MNIKLFRYLDSQRRKLQQEVKSYEKPQPLHPGMPWTWGTSTSPQKDYKYQGLVAELRTVLDLMADIAGEGTVLSRSLRGDTQRWYTMSTVNSNYPYGGVIPGERIRVGEYVDSLRIQRGHEIHLPEAPCKELVEGQSAFDVCCSLGQVYALYICKGISREQSKALAAIAKEVLGQMPREMWRLENIEYRMACSKMVDSEEFVWLDYCEAIQKDPGDFWERRNKTLWAI